MAPVQHIDLPTDFIGSHLRLIKSFLGILADTSHELDGFGIEILRAQRARLAALLSTVS